MAQQKRKPAGRKQQAVADNKIVKEVLGVILICFGVLLGLCTYSSYQAPFATFVRVVFFGLFGFFGYFIPIVFAIGGFFIIVRAKRKMNKGTVWATVLLIICFLSLLDVCTARTYSAGGISYFPYLGQSFEIGKEMRGGGLFGGILAYPVELILGNVGAIILFAALIVSGVMLLTKLSLHDMVLRMIDAYKDWRDARPRETVVVETPPEDEVFYIEENAKQVEQAYQETFDYNADAYGQDMPADTDTTSPADTEEEEDKELYVDDVERRPNEPQMVTLLTEMYGDGAFPSANDAQMRSGAEVTLGGGIAEHFGDTFEIETHEGDLGPEVEFSPKTPSSREMQVEYARQQAAQQLELKGVEETLEQNKPVYALPGRIDLLDAHKKKQTSRSDRMAQENKAAVLEQTLKSFNVHATVNNIVEGPTVTRYELQPAPGVKVNRIVGLANDIALNLAAPTIRIEAPIPGKAAIGIEVPNTQVAMVGIREMLDTPEFRDHKSKLAFAVGKDITGKNVYGDLASMPHLLIAGTTGSGKSICVNSIIMSILYKCSPDEVELMMVDPKVVEFTKFNGIPHMKTDVVTDPKKAPGMLHKAVEQMQWRYKRFADAGVRDIDEYNSLERLADEPIMTKIVIIIDELADLMMASAKEVEDSICRIAQLGRASGIHLVIATQSPRVDVITGLIKANIPSRIALTVSSAIDSRTILDMSGAEKLLGKGDMLYLPTGQNKPTRLQGCFISQGENQRVIKFLKEAGLESNYDEELTEEIEKSQVAGGSGGGGGVNGVGEDALIQDAVRVALENDKGQVSTSYVQRRLRVGYARAARIIDEMEELGFITAPDGNKPREVLISWEDYQRLFGEGADEDDWNG